MAKIVIVVKGGIVQSVYSDDESIDVVVADLDMDTDAIHGETEGLICVY